MLVLLHVSVFVCLFMCKCVVVDIFVSDFNLNLFSRGIQTMRAHSFLKFAFLTVREKH